MWKYLKFSNVLYPTFCRKSTICWKIQINYIRYAKQHFRNNVKKVAFRESPLSTATGRRFGGMQPNRQFLGIGKQRTRSRYGTQNCGIFRRFLRLSSRQITFARFNYNKQDIVDFIRKKTDFVEVRLFLSLIIVICLFARISVLPSDFRR